MSDNQTQTAKALIVDDIFINRMLIAEMLEQMGWTYEEAENGKEAIEKLQGKDFDVVLMDIEMPVMNGIEATIYIKKNLAKDHPHLKVYGVTAHDPKSFFKDYTDVQFDGIITKPYTLDKLMDMITQA